MNQKVKANEWQVDGLVGPTHNYAGLAFGNVASANHKFSVSNPREAALQGIAKMRFVAEHYGHQLFFIPHYRPIISELKRLGFGGSPAQLVDNTANAAPELLASVYSASAMWAANAATVIPSPDSRDGKLHFIPANLMSSFHRMVESPFTTRMLKRMFADTDRFVVHEPLPNTPRFGDEGAANHMRIVEDHGDKACHVFVYGASSGAGLLPTRFPPRQHEEASRAVASMGQLADWQSFFVQQRPEAIDAGVFHHDVIGMNCLGFMAQHARALVDGEALVAKLSKRLENGRFRLYEVSDDELSLEAAVKSYFFNSQLLGDETGIQIIAPMECAETPEAHALFERFKAEGLVRAVHYHDVRESMKNGGGPACLRLRVVLTEEEAKAVQPGVVLTPEKADALEGWVKRHYRDRLCFDDLRDPMLIREVEEALDDLSRLVGMEGIYPFQS